MNDYEKLKYLTENIRPLAVGKGFYYRASVYLRDNTYLPCVIFTNPRSTVHSTRDKILEAENEPVKLSGELWPLIEGGNKVEFYKWLTKSNLIF